MAGIPPRQAPLRAAWPAPRWHAGTVLLALVPVVSLGTLAFAPAAYLSVLRRNTGSWVALGVSAAMTGTELYMIETVPSNSPSSAGAGFFALLTMFAPAVHYVISLRNWQRQRAWETVPAQPQGYPPPYGHHPYQQSQPQPYLPPQAYQPPPQAQLLPQPQPQAQAQPQPLPQPMRYDPPAPLTEDVGAELRRLSERLRGPQGGEPGQ